MQVVEATRSHLTVRCGGRAVTVYGEMLGKSPGMPDYQVYAYALTHWDAPDDASLLTSEEKAAILAEVCDYLTGHERTPVVE
jgi:hypothetical protein